MPVDNDIYNQPGDIWWDEHQPLSAIRTALNPARLEYFTRIVSERGIDLAGAVTVDVGCGGGLMAEEMARRGAHVIGVDPSVPSLATARAHGAEEGLTIDYRQGAGEHLPVDDASADIVYCVDVLEHVDDVDAVIGETARVLKPGGLYLYDTINRTRLSKIVMIDLSQNWAATAWMPKDLHDWNQFVTPTEMREALSRHCLESAEMIGMAPSVAPPTLFRLLRQLKMRRFSYGDFGRKAPFKLTKDLRISYLGYATKPVS